MSDVQWRKSSHSGNQGECVEVASSEEEVLLRDSKDPEGPWFRFTHDAWAGLLAQVGRGSL